MAIKNLKITEKLHGKDWEKNDIYRTYYNDVKVDFERTGNGSKGEFVTNDDRNVSFYYDHTFQTFNIKEYKRSFGNPNDKKEFETLLIELLEKTITPESAGKKKPSINDLRESIKTSVKTDRKFTGDMEEDKFILSDEEFEDIYDMPKELC